MGDTVSRPKGGTIKYRNEPQFKPSFWGKKQGDLFAKSKGKHGFGAYSKDPMRFVTIEREVRMIRHGEGGELRLSQASERTGEVCGVAGVTYKVVLPQAA